MILNTATVSQYQATARHHLKMARAFESVGKMEDAKSAREAAAKCIETMGRLMVVYEADAD